MNNALVIATIVLTLFGLIVLLLCESRLRLTMCCHVADCLQGGAWTKSMVVEW